MDSHRGWRWVGEGRDVGPRWPDDPNGHTCPQKVAQECSNFFKQTTEWFSRLHLVIQVILFDHSTVDRPTNAPHQLVVFFFS